MQCVKRRAPEPTLRDVFKLVGRVPLRPVATPVAPQPEPAIEIKLIHRPEDHRPFWLVGDAGPLESRQIESFPTRSEAEAAMPALARKLRSRS